MKKIVVGIDGSEASDAALERAIAELQCFGGEMVVVSVAESLSVLSLRERENDCVSAWEALMREPRQLVDRAVARAKEACVMARGLVEAGRPAETIAKIARQEKADEIIVGSLGKHAVDRLLIGNVSGRLVEIAPCTIVVVR